MLAQCRQHGLPVIESDAVAYLQSRPASSLGAVTGFHIIEHLPFPVLIQLLDETVRVLQPGGLAIFETPNPQNILVGSCNFYADPTHRNPLFPGTVKFLAENRGLVDVHIKELTEHRGTTAPIELLSPDHPLAMALNPVLELLKRCFTAGPDFAVVGRKAPLKNKGGEMV
jgi:O-antigen chain-terminating methyltransferase